MTSTRALLQPAPTSAGAARSLVQQACTAAGASRFLETAVLLTSELVTNAIVHAHSQFEVVIEAAPAGIRVEVRDTDERMPEKREYDDDASTGRGSLLVEALADAFGADPLGRGGKAVWFSVGTPPPWEHETAEPVPALVVDQSVHVELVALPTHLYRSWQQNADGLLREAFLEGSHAPAGGRPVMGLEEHAIASRALSLVVDAVRTVLVEQSLLDRATVSLAVPVGDVLAFSVLRGALGKAAAAAGAGLLLCPPGLPDLGSLRDWCCDEVARQASGLPPQPWRRPTPIDPQGSGVRAACLAVRASPAAEVLADDHNVLIAASASACRLLGWPDGHLEGARVTVLVPKRYVDAHLAGFDRLLTTGEGRLMDQPVELPARCRDGSERHVLMTLSQRIEPDGRIFHALLEPL